SSPESHASLRRLISLATKRCRKTKTTSVPKAKATVAQQEMRQAALRMGGLPVPLPILEDIAHTSHGPDQRRLSGAIYLTAEPVNMHVDHVCLGLNPHAPHLVENHRARDHAARITA